MHSFFIMSYFIFFNKKNDYRFASVVRAQIPFRIYNDLLFVQKPTDV